jgi:ABC-type phosphate transport system permease subunit
VAERDEAAARTAVASLVGRGAGLTPTGDDLLAGLVATARLLVSTTASVDAGTRRLVDAVAEQALALAPTHTTALSAALLACADRGAVAGPVAGLVRALATGVAVEPAAAALCRVGHSSGYDLARGAGIGARLALSRGGLSR